MSEVTEGTVALVCPVRGCAEVLVSYGEGDKDLRFQYRAAGPARSLRCTKGHAFDRARSGYWNLLQPQDRRSSTPGDRKSMALARRRLFTRGLQERLVEVLSARAREAAPTGRAVLDVGCGEGSIGAAVARGFDLHGVDLSAPSIELAARAFPEATWVVANADRGLPYAAGSFDVVLSIAARRPGAELRRVLRPAGTLLVAVPGPADLAELRHALLGGSAPLPGATAVAEELGAWFRTVAIDDVECRLDLDREVLEDLLLATYRGQRTSAAERRGQLDALRVTVAQQILVLQAREPSPHSG